MAACRRVYDSRHLQADCQEPGSAPEPYTLGNRVWATFTFLQYDHRLTNKAYLSAITVTNISQSLSHKMAAK